jgi:hypothetical protein
MRCSARTARIFSSAPLTAEVIKSHLLGRSTAGLYALTPDNALRWVALHADRDDGLEQIQQAWRQLETRGISSHLERSRRGGHLWILFEPIQAGLARRLTMGCLPELPAEVFPKRDQLNEQSRVGNLVRGPFGIHRLTGKRYPFVDPISLEPISRTVVRTLDYLGEVDRLRVDRVAELLAALPGPAGGRPGPVERGAAPVAEDRRRQTPLQRLKAKLGDPYDFISRYMELDQDGRGHCPSHPPDHHPSFAVNRADGYWVDLHEVDPQTGRYVEGDVIAFYRRLRGLSYKQVLEELGQ